MARLEPQGELRDAIVSFLRNGVEDDASVDEIAKAVDAKLKRPIRPSLVRSYLNVNVPEIFTRTRRGHYRLTKP